MHFVRICRCPIPGGIRAARSARGTTGRDHAVWRHTLQKEWNMAKYEVIVIGAGNAGLTAAATLAKAGVPTLLLERRRLFFFNNSCSVFFREKWKSRPFHIYATRLQK